MDAYQYSNFYIKNRDNFRKIPGDFKYYTYIPYFYIFCNTKKKPN